MPAFRLTLTFTDTLDGETTRSYEGTFDTSVDAETAAAALIPTIPTDAAISRVQLTQELASLTTSPAAAASNVFERALMSVRKSDGAKATLDVPSPTAAVFSGNAVVAASVSAFVANFETAGAFTISDGEKLATGAFLSGRRVFRSSGKTNLPV